MQNILKLLKLKINISKFLKTFVFILTIPLLLNSCKSPDGKFKLPGGDARKFPADPAKRVEKNLKEGRGFKINDAFGNQKGGVFDFASSNELWRASLDTIDFMPLLSVNYSGGIIVTDWYSDEQSASGESVKISIRFLTNEIRADALDIKVFNKKCNDVSNCVIKEIDDELAPELTKQILKKATLYKKEALDKKNN
tara:strand:+ start:101 stop:688 length:588 start_codon:yes stop_codon:yes gene_type:complete